MSVEFTEEQQLWHETVHRFMDQEVGREYTREHDQSREYPEEVFQKMAALGWLGLLIAEEDGNRVGCACHCVSRRTSALNARPG